MINLNSEGEELLKKLLEGLKQEDSVVISQLNDTRLMKIAEYEASKGYMMPLNSVGGDKLQEKFTEFKMRVRSGSLTIKQLEDDVYTRWGIQEKSRVDALRNNEPTVITGFNIDKLNVAKIADNDKRNS